MTDFAIIIAESEAALDAQAAASGLTIISKRAFDTLSTYPTPGMPAAGDIDVATGGWVALATA